MNNICPLYNIENQAHNTANFNKVVSYLKDSHFHCMGFKFSKAVLIIFKSCKVMK